MIGPGAPGGQCGAMYTTNAAPSPERREHDRRYRVDLPDGSRHVVCAIDARTAVRLVATPGDQVTVTDLDALDEWQRQSLRAIRAEVAAGRRY